MINFWESLIKGMFSPFLGSNEKEETERKNITEPDFIDYDGIGNQGRFIKRGKNSEKR